MAEKEPGPAKALVFSTNDCFGSPVRLEQERWTNHIIDPYDGHTELVGHEADVQLTVEDPDQIRPSTQTGKAFGFERALSTSETLRVIVYYDDPVQIWSGNTVGNVSTAYIDDQTTISRVGPVVWQRPTVSAAGARSETSIAAVSESHITEEGDV